MSGNSSSRESAVKFKIIFILFAAVNLLIGFLIAIVTSAVEREIILLAAASFIGVVMTAVWIVIIRFLYTSEIIDIAYSEDECTFRTLGKTYRISYRDVERVNVVNSVIPPDLPRYVKIKAAVNGKAKTLISMAFVGLPTIDVDEMRRYFIYTRINY